MLLESCRQMVQTAKMSRAANLPSISAFLGDPGDSRGAKLHLWQTDWLATEQRQRPLSRSEFVCFQWLIIICSSFENTLSFRPPDCFAYNACKYGLETCRYLVAVDKKQIEIDNETNNSDGCVMQTNELEDSDAHEANQLLQLRVVLNRM
jgi:hypothetical protein